MFFLINLKSSTEFEKYIENFQKINKNYEEYNQLFDDFFFQHMINISQYKDQITEKISNSEEKDFVEYYIIISQLNQNNYDEIYKQIFSTFFKKISNFLYQKKNQQLNLTQTQNCSEHIEKIKNNGLKKQIEEKNKKMIIEYNSQLEKIQGEQEEKTIEIINLCKNLYITKLIEFIDIIYNIEKLKIIANIKSPPPQNEPKIQNIQSKNNIILISVIVGFILIILLIPFSRKKKKKINKKRQLEKYLESQI